MAHRSALSIHHPPPNRLHTAVWLLRYPGPSWLGFRFLYSLRKRLGILRRACPERSWDNAADVVSFDAEALEQRVGRLALRLVPTSLTVEKPSACIEESERILSGTFPHFGVHWLERGLNPDWFSDPFNQTAISPVRHWTSLHIPAGLDLKNVWELSRFAWVFPLIRAEIRNPDAERAGFFRRMFAHWCAANPPHSGPHWACGQEITFRMIALLYGAMVFRRPAGAFFRETPLAGLCLWESARRIEVNLPYALSQKNNHGILESIGLWTLGLLFAGEEAGARWIKKGRESLRSQLEELVYEDGTFAQRSTNYTRLICQTMLFQRSVLEALQIPVPDWLDSALRRAGSWLWNVCQPQTGSAPNLGGNDGALLLPLTDCAFHDFRPILHTLHRVSGIGCELPDGPWSEEADWLAGPHPRTRQDPNPAHGKRFHSSGFSAFLHVPEFRHRPANADLLHADLWFDGQPLTRDPGSFSYAAPAPFDTYFRETHWHNTIEVAGQSQMAAASHFLLLPWISCRRRVPDAGLSRLGWSVQAGGYPIRSRKGPSGFHHRAVYTNSRCAVIRDRINLPHPCPVRLHWLLSERIQAPVEEGSPDVPTWLLDCTGGRFRLTLIPPAGPFQTSCVSGSDTSARGWVSLAYQKKIPVFSIDLVQTLAGGEWITLWTLADDPPPRWESEGKLILGRESFELGDFPGPQ